MSDNKSGLKLFIPKDDEDQYKEPSPRQKKQADKYLVDKDSSKSKTSKLIVDKSSWKGYLEPFGLTFESLGNG